MTLLAFAAERRAAVCRATEAPLLLSADRAAAVCVCRATEAPLLLSADRAAIDRYLLPAGPTAANPPHADAVVDSSTDRWTD